MLVENNKILVGKNEELESSYLLINKANRHGLITGASGSGKTITLKVLAESFSDAGVPVFLADVKGDLAGTALEGSPNPNIESRLKSLDIKDFTYKKYPVRFWDLYGTRGTPIRAKVENVGVEILSMMLGLNEAEEGNLAIAFKIAKDKSMTLNDLNDLKSLLQYISENKKDFISEYGNITSQSVGVIQRNLLKLSEQGGNIFFGIPSLDINDLINNDLDGRGIINILDAVKLFTSPDLYASFLIWILNELFTRLPEVGDLDKPKLVFFFDEAHLLFNNLPSYRLKSIVQMVKLIRSKGVGLYFISQSPSDVPDEISAQLGNRIQHTLRSYTPQELKVVHAAAMSFRENPKLNIEETIQHLGTGEALVSFQDEDGIPTISQKITVLPPQSKMGTIDDTTRNNITVISPYHYKYLNVVNESSATEIVNQENAIKEQKKEQEELEKQKIKEQKEQEKIEKEKEKEMKKNPMYKIGKKATNKVINKVLDKSISSIFKDIFK